MTTTNKKPYDTVEATDAVLDTLIADTRYHTPKRIDGVAYLHENRSCVRCSGAGYGGWRQDGGICYACGGTGGRYTARIKVSKRNGTLNREFGRLYISKVAPEILEAEARADYIKVCVERKDAIRDSIRRGELTREHLDALRVMRDTDFGKSLRGSVIRWGNLTTAQADAIVAAAARKVAQDAARAAEVAVAAPTGRVEITGTIVSTKVRDSLYGVVGKMLVKVTTDAGVYKVWATATDAIVGQSPVEGTWADRLGALRGCALSCNVTLKPSDDDPSFAFGSRPGKATVTPAAG